MKRIAAVTAAAVVAAAAAFAPAGFREQCRVGRVDRRTRIRRFRRPAGLLGRLWVPR